MIPGLPRRPAVARRQHHQLQRPRVRRDQLLHPPRVDHHAPRLARAVERQPVGPADRRPVAQDQQRVDRRLLAPRPLERRRERREGRVRHDIATRHEPLPERRLQRRLMLRRRHRPARGRPREQHPTPPPRQHRIRKAARLRPLIPDHQPRDPAQQLPRRLQRHQLPRQRIELRRRRADRDVDRRPRPRRRHDRLLARAPADPRQKLAEHPADAMQQLRIRRRLTQRLQVLQQRPTPRELRRLEAPARRAHQVRLRREAKAVRLPGALRPGELEDDVQRLAHHGSRITGQRAQLPRLEIVDRPDRDQQDVLPRAQRRRHPRE